MNGRGLTKKKAELRAKQTIVIAIITLLVVVVLGFMVGRQFVGQAIGGIPQPTQALQAGQQATIPIRATLEAGEQLDSFRFIVQADTASEIDLCNPSVTVTTGYAAGQSMGGLRRCTNGALDFQDAFTQLRDVPQGPGEFTLATLSFTVPDVDELTFDFSQFQVRSNGQNVIEGIPADVVIPIGSDEVGPGAQPLQLTANGQFNNNQAMPLSSACLAAGGQNTNPTLTITNVPVATQTIALIMEDLDSLVQERPAVHWAVFIPVTSPPSQYSIGSTLPAQSITVVNDIDQMPSYAGPCPLEGETVHNYRFRAYALSRSITLADINSDSDAVIDSTDLASAQVQQILSASGVSSATLTGTYQVVAMGGEQCTDQQCRAQGFILENECPDNGEGQCPVVDTGIVTEFCGANAANQAACSTMCTNLNLCPEGTGSSEGYTVNINGDDKIDGKDSFIILKIAEAIVRDDCGGSSQEPCGPYSGTYTCDSGDFRVDQYKGYAPREGEICANFANTAAYISGTGAAS